MKPDSGPRRPHTTQPPEGQRSFSPEDFREVNVAVILGVFRDLGQDDPEESSNHDRNA